MAVIAGVQFAFPLIKKLQGRRAVAHFVAQIVRDPAIGINIKEVLAQVDRNRENLAREADIGKSRPVAVTESACLAVLRQMRLERLERFQRPVLQPPVARGLV